MWKGLSLGLLALAFVLYLYQHLSLDIVLAELVDAFSDPMIKGAFVMGIIFQLKDTFVSFITTLWSATIGMFRPTTAMTWLRDEFVHFSQSVQ